MFTPFSGHHVGVPRRYTNIVLHTRLCKFVQNLLTNIWGLGKLKDLKLVSEVSFFIDLLSITVSWLYPLNGVRMIFYCVTMQTSARQEFTCIWSRFSNEIGSNRVTGSCLFILGDITYLLKIVIESMLWLDDLSNPGSLASQQLSKKLQQAVCIKLLLVQKMFPI